VGVILRLLWLYSRQRSIVYNRGVISRQIFTAQVLATFQNRAQLLAPFDALVLEPHSMLPVGTAIWLHGNGGSALDRAHFVPVFAERGIRLILAEYPGHAARGGEPSEKALVEDALALYENVKLRYPGPLWLVGESLGTGVATQVAARASSKPERLILLTPFLSLAAAAAALYPLIPVRLILKDIFDSAAQLTTYRGAVSILVAQADEVIDPRQARGLGKIAQRCGEDTRVLEIPLATHRSWCTLITEQQWTYLLDIAVCA
jgi:alpha-beta hydrolase superfamily lysophospholipase